MATLLNRTISCLRLLRHELERDLERVDSYRPRKLGIGWKRCRSHFDLRTRRELDRLDQPVAAAPFWPCRPEPQKRCSPAGRRNCVDFHRYVRLIEGRA